MPTLILPRSPIKLDLNKLQAVMLWPEAEQAAWRETVLDTGAVQFLLEVGPNVVADATVDPDTLRWIADSVPVDDVQERTKVRYRHGVAAGIFALRIIDAAKNGPVNSTTVADARTHAAGKLTAAMPTSPLTVGTLNSQALPIMRPSIHLWAAHVASMAEGQGAFPCSRSNLAAFVCRASRLRDAAAAVRYRGNSARLIDGDVWEVALSD